MMLDFIVIFMKYVLKFIYDMLAFKNYGTTILWRYLFPNFIKELKSIKLIQD